MPVAAVLRKTVTLVQIRFRSIQFTLFTKGYNVTIPLAA
jgi:hypothetical protein